MSKGARCPGQENGVDFLTILGEAILVSLHFLHFLFLFNIRDNGIRCLGDLFQDV